MLRITRLSDYAVRVLCTMYQVAGDRAFSARAAAQATGLPLPAVSKILKRLAQRSIVVSQRGSLGGYRMPRQPAQIALSEVVDALEGPFAFTDCGNGKDDGPGCEYRASCAVQANWARVSSVVRRALASVTIADMLSPGRRALVPLRLGRVRASAGAHGSGSKSSFEPGVSS